MPTHHLTGNDLEALLARVPAEHGPEAVIVEANKLRTGGVAGFFAKECFEVVVEVPEGAAPAAPVRTGPPATSSPASRATSLDDLIAAASSADGFEATTSRRAPQRPLRATPAPEPGPEPTAAPREPLPEPRVEVEPPPVTASAPTLSTDGQPFADVLSRLVRDITADGAGDAPAGVGVAGPAGVATPDEPFEPFEPFHAVRVVGPAVTAAAAPATDVSLAASAPAPAGTVVAEAPRALPQPVVEPAWLARVGVPADIAAGLLPAGDPAIELLRMLERIPRPEALPTAPGCVIAVVGGQEEARAVAEQLAGALRLDPDGIVVAAPRFGRSGVPQERRITCADHADDRRRAWRRRRTPTIVAVDSPVSLDPGGTSWALHLVDALEPSQVWGVVDATRKTEDIATWNELVGGIDALAVTALHATSSPASILGAGIPVGLLDGHDATPARWAAVLTERMAA